MTATTTAGVSASTASPRPSPSAAGVVAPRPVTAAPLIDPRVRRIQIGMFIGGAALMPLGVLAICLGWYGSAHSHYTYDQNTYLISGGILGLGLTFFGGFVYFGAWLARMAADQREGTRALTDALLALSNAVTERVSAAESPAAGQPAASEFVLAGDGTTVHLRSCPLIASRDDLVAYRNTGSATTTCRVCRPGESMGTS